MDTIKDADDMYQVPGIIMTVLKLLPVYESIKLIVQLYYEYTVLVRAESHNNIMFRKPARFTIPSRAPPRRDGFPHRRDTEVITHAAASGQGARKGLLCASDP